jgi:hypothetical protein
LGFTLPHLLAGAQSGHRLDWMCVFMESSGNMQVCSVMPAKEPATQCAAKEPEPSHSSHSVSISSSSREGGGGGEGEAGEWRGGCGRGAGGEEAEEDAEAAETDAEEEETSAVARCMDSVLDRAMPGWGGRVGGGGGWPWLFGGFAG